VVHYANNYLKDATMNTNGYNYLARYIDSLQAKGRYAFSYDEIEEQFDLGYESLRKALNRLSKKHRIVLIRDKFYVIVPLEYSSQGILPASFFIDELMSYQDKIYYVSLLSAAALQGASHQQPQIFQVMTVKPTCRLIQVKGLQIKFYFKSEMPKYGMVKHKTDTGYIQVSNAALTAIDLVLFERRVGGLVRVAELLGELTESIDVDSFKEVLNNDFPCSTLQRLGYLLDRILGIEHLYTCIEDVLQKRVFYRVPLDPASEKTGKPVDPKWKVIINSDLEVEL
jgi:predicted transcriptional regulator of viral defense system